MPPALGNVRRGAGASKATFCQDIEHKFNLEDNNFKQLYHKGMGSPRLPSTATRSSWQEGALLETQHPSHVVCLRFPKITVSSCTPGYVATDLAALCLRLSPEKRQESGGDTTSAATSLKVPSIYMNQLLLFRPNSSTRVKFFYTPN